MPSNTYAIIGAGSIGLTLAAALAHKGHAVTLFATPRTAKDLLATGAITLYNAIDVTHPVAEGTGHPGAIGVITDPNQLPPNAGAIFTPKGHQLPQAIAQVSAAWPRPDDHPSWVCGIQNGIVKDDLLRAAFGPERTVGALTIVGAERQPGGRVSVKNLDTTYIGEFSGAASPRVTQAAADLNDAKLITEAVDNIATVLWSKMCNTAGFFAATCTGRIPNAVLGLHPDLVRLYLGVLRETAAIAAAEGVTVQDYPRFPVRTYLDRDDDENVARFHDLATSTTAVNFAPDQRSSMLQDLLAGRPMEIDAIFGDLITRANRHGVPTPHITRTYEALRTLNG
jgi:2-dehydropantoate 2-reductase